MLGFFDKIKFVLTRPKYFFQTNKKEKGVWPAFAFYAVLAFIMLLFGYFIGFLFHDWYYYVLSSIIGFTLPDPYTKSIFISLGTLLTSFVWNLVFVFAGAGILHLWILIFRGKETYSKTFQIHIYATIPVLLFSWIPFMPFFIWIYGMILTIIAVQVIHGIKKKTAIWMFVIPAIFLVLIFIVGMIVFADVYHAHPELFADLARR